MPITQTVQLQGFEVGDPSFGDSQYAHPHSVRVMDGGSTQYASEVPFGSGAAPPARQGSRLMRALIKNGDSPPFGSTLRAEIQYPNVPVGSITWDGFSVYYPTNMTQMDPESSSAFRICGQWHEGGGSPSFRLDTNTRKDGVVRITRRIGTSVEAQNDVIGTVAELAGKWVDYVVWAKWTNASDGWFVMWASIDGGPWTQVSRAAWESGIQTLNGGTVCYFKHGIYGSMGGLLYFDWTKRILVDDAGDYFADVQTPNTPPADGGGTPPALPVDSDPLAISVVGRGGAYSDTAATTLTIPGVEVEEGKSLLVGAMARIAAGATVTGVTWNGQAMNIVAQHESALQVPSALAVVAELHDVEAAVGDVVITYSTAYETASGVASEAWDIVPAVASEVGAGVSASPDSGGLDTTSFPAFMMGYVFVGGTQADTAPDLGGVISRVGQRVGDVSEPLANTTTNEGYGSQVIGGTREVLASLPSTDRIWIAALVVFPVVPQEHSDEFKRYASLNWAIPLTGGS